MNVEEILARYRGRWDEKKLAALLLEFVQHECISGELTQFLDRKQLDEMVAERSVES